VVWFHLFSPFAQGAKRQKSSLTQLRELQSCGHFHLLKHRDLRRTNAPKFSEKPWNRNLRNLCDDDKGLARCF